MDRTIRQHLQLLEALVLNLSEQSMSNGLSLDERNEIESQIRATRVVIDYYRQALHMEGQLTSRR